MAIDWTILPLAHIDVVIFVILLIINLNYWAYKFYKLLKKILTEQKEQNSPLWSEKNE